MTQGWEVSLCGHLEPWGAEFGSDCYSSPGFLSLWWPRDIPLWSMGRKNNYSSLGRLQKHISHHSLKELPHSFPNGSRGTWHALPVPLLSTSSSQFLAECHLLPGSLWCSWKWHRSLHPELVTLIGTLNSCVTEPHLMCFCCPRA